MDGLHSTAAPNGTRSSTGLNPKSSPLASQRPRTVWGRMGSATSFCCISITHSVGEKFLPHAQQDLCQTWKSLSANSLGSILGFQVAKVATLTRHQLGIHALCCKCDIAVQHLKSVDYETIW